MKNGVKQHRRKLKKLYLVAQEEYKAALEYCLQASMMHEGCAVSREQLRRSPRKHPGTKFVPPPPDQ